MWRGFPGFPSEPFHAALNAPDTVRPGTLGKVRAAIQSLGFQPDFRAQNMRRRNTMTVGFVIDDIANPWHASCFKAVDAEMRQRGFSLYLVSTNGRASEEAAAIDMLQHGRADGVIMTINNEQDARTIKRLEGTAHPLRAARPRHPARDRRGADRTRDRPAAGDQLSDRARAPAHRDHHRRAATSGPGASGCAASSRPSRSAACRCPKT